VTAVEKVVTATAAAPKELRRFLLIVMARFMRAI
jgi:hypothetical protein